MRTPSTQGDERGVVMILMALTLVMLTSFVAIVVDLGNARQVARNLQNAADAGALAGAQELPTTANAVLKAATYAASTLNLSSAVPTSTTCPAGSTATNCYTTGTGANTASIYVTSPYQASTSKIAVQVCRTVTYVFARVIGRSTSTPCRRASAGMSNVLAGGVSVLVLAPTGAKTLTCSGSCNLDVGTGAIVNNSTTAGAIDVSGGTQIISGQIHGYVRTSGGGVVSCQNPVSPCPTDQNQTSDPFASLAAPPVPAATYSGAYVPVFSPGHYTGTLTVNSAVACLNAGTYYLDNGLTFSGGSTVTICPGSEGGVFFYVAGGKFTISGGSSLVATPPTFGTYGGVMVFQARTNTNTLTLSGGSALSMPGTLYNPAGNTTLSGGSSSTDASGLGQIITNTLTVSGSSQVGPGFGGSGGSVGVPTIGMSE